jgi:hypothetical protein
MPAPRRVGDRFEFAYGTLPHKATDVTQFPIPKIDV